jgi:hypothetical protein
MPPQTLTGESEASLFHERHDKRAEAAVHVHANVVALGQGSHLHDRIHGAVRVLWTRADNGNGVAVDVATNASDVSFAVGQHWKLDELLRKGELGRLSALL